MPPTCDRQWCIRQITRDARSPARGRTPEDQIAGAADHRSHRAVKPNPERHERDPSRHLLRGCTKFWQLTLTPTRRKVRSPNEKFLSVVAPAAVPFTPQPRKEHTCLPEQSSSPARQENREICPTPSMSRSYPC